MSERWLWRCPVCGRLNVEDIVNAWLECVGCGKVFDYMDVQLTPEKGGACDE